MLYLRELFIVYFLLNAATRAARIRTITIIAKESASPIHSGERTQTHDHEITPVSLRTMNAIVSSPANPIPPPLVFAVIFACCAIFITFQSLSKYLVVFPYILNYILQKSVCQHFLRFLFSKDFKKFSENTGMSLTISFQSHNVVDISKKDA